MTLAPAFQLLSRHLSFWSNLEIMSLVALSPTDSISLHWHQGIEYRLLFCATGEGWPGPGLLQTSLCRSVQLDESKVQDNVTGLEVPVLAGISFGI